MNKTTIIKTLMAAGALMALKAIYDYLWGNVLAFGGEFMGAACLFCAAIAVKHLWGDITSS